MSRTKHAVTRCAWCGRQIKRGMSAKGKRGQRFCPDGSCGGLPQGHRATRYAVRALDDNDLWWGAETDHAGPLVHGLERARLFRSQTAAAKISRRIARGAGVIEVRCHAVSCYMLVEGEE